MHCFGFWNDFLVLMVLQMKNYLDWVPSTYTTRKWLNNLSKGHENWWFLTNVFLAILFIHAKYSFRFCVVWGANCWLQDKCLQSIGDRYSLTTHMVIGFVAMMNEFGLLFLLKSNLRENVHWHSIYYTAPHVLFWLIVFGLWSEDIGPYGLARAHTHNLPLPLDFFS